MKCKACGETRDFFADCKEVSRVRLDISRKGELKDYTVIQSLTTEFSNFECGNCGSLDVDQAEVSA